MKNLQEEQREMRERMRAAKPKKASAERGSCVEPSETRDLQKLLKQIKILEAENASLRRQLSELREQPRPREHSRQMSDSERRHLFMKYSNVRRY
jgi:predicted  nucleic acid-binding Zn-ribbon protein